MKNVLLIFGGMTSEHHGSCVTSADILDWIDREKYCPVTVGITREGQWFYTEASSDEIRDEFAWQKSPSNRKAMLDTNYGSKRLLVFEDSGVREIPVDCVFVRMAGNTGEDGKLQGLCEVAGVPYVGCGVAASACGMDKELSYILADSVGVDCPGYMAVNKLDYERSRSETLAALERGLLARVGYPVFVKPASNGSSFGISKVRNEAELTQALDAAFSFDTKILVEEAISGSELKLAVLGNDDPTVGAVCELTMLNGGFDDYNAKYVTHDAKRVIPALLPPETEKTVREQTRLLYKRFGCCGFSRVDFFRTPDERIVFNEINTNPGFGAASIFARMFQAVGMSYTEQISRLIETAFDKIEEI